MRRLIDKGFSKMSFRLAAALMLSLANAAWAGDTIRIGFVSTFSGPAAAIGNDARMGLNWRSITSAAKWTAGRSK